MEKGKYLRIVGYIELVASIIGIIAGFIYMIGVSAGATWAVSSFGSKEKAITGFTLFLCWALYLFACFLAPAVGILFITVGDLWDEGGATYSAPKIMSYNGANPNNPNEVEILRERLRKVEDSIDHSVKDDSKEDDLSVEDEDESVEEPKKNSKNPSLAKQDVVTGKGKDNYQIGDRIMINDEVVINGIKIKKGSTGVIDNRLMSYKGRTYIVILDKPKKTVELTGNYFE